VTWLYPYQGLLLNMRQLLPKDHPAKEDAYKALKTLTGQDFGYDIDAWQQWLKAHNKK